MSKLVRFDWAIKYLLRNKANFDILEGFLSELLHEPGLTIQTVLESEGNKETREDKFNRVDVVVKTQEGKYIIVEVQCYRQWDFLTRILYGTSKLICEYLSEGQDYYKVAKVVSVSIVFFDLGTGDDYLYKGETIFTGMHRNDTLGLNKNEQKIYQPIHFKCPEHPKDIYPEYYIIKVTRFGERVKNKLDEWIYFLKNGEIKKEFTAKGLGSASNKLDVLKLNKEQRKAYEWFQRDLRDSASFDSTLRAEKEVELEKVHSQGKKEGKIEGIVIGEAAMLKNQLEQRFGGLSAEYIDRLNKADAEMLMRWGMRILSAENLANVFED